LVYLFGLLDSGGHAEDEYCGADSWIISKTKVSSLLPAVFISCICRIPVSYTLF